MKGRIFPAFFFPSISSISSISIYFHLIATSDLIYFLGQFIKIQFYLAMI